ncbi:MAG: hypothetical protein ACLSHJ_07175 [Oscillospiraceae bacterium]
MPLVMADAAALPFCPADSLHVARQVLQLLLDERFSGVSAHIKMLPMLKTLTEA